MKFLRHLAGYAPVNLANALVSFGGVYVFTRLLGGEDYGRYALMLSLQGLIHTLCLTWAEAAAFRFAAEAEAQGQRAAHLRTMASLLVRSLVLPMLALGLAAWVFRGDAAYLGILGWLAVLIPINAVIQLTLEMHRARHQVQRYALVATTRALGAFALGALLAWQSGLGPAAPFAGFVLSGLLALAIEGAWLLSNSKGAAYDPERAKDALRYGVPIALALVLDLLLSAGDRFMLAYFLDETAVGAYAAGYGVADKTVLLICAWAAMAGSPLLISAWESGGAEAARVEARGLIGFILLLGLPAATGLALVARPLAEVMIAEELREQAMQTIPWIAFAGLLNGLLIHYWTESFQLTRRTGLRAALMAIPTVANLAANAVLIPAIGLMGAVYATVGSYLLGNLVLALAGRRLLALPLPLGEAARLALAAAAMAGVVWLVPDWGGLVELIVKAVIGGVVYGAAAISLNAGGARKLIAARFRTGPKAAA